MLQTSILLLELLLKLKKEWDFNFNFNQHWHLPTNQQQQIPAAGSAGGSSYSPGAVVQSKEKVKKEWDFNQHWHVPTKQEQQQTCCWECCKLLSFSWSCCRNWRKNEILINIDMYHQTSNNNKPVAGSTVSFCPSPEAVVESEQWMRVLSTLNSH